jgi:hypothetical protein
LANKKGLNFKKTLEMRVGQMIWDAESGWKTLSQHSKFHPQLVLAFGAREILSNPDRYDELRSFFPESNILTCSTAGEIVGSKVTDNTIVVSALEFQKTTVRISEIKIEKSQNSYECGKALARDLLAEDLAHILVIADGHVVNGGDLISGFNINNERKIPITGGLAGDGSLFEKTLVGNNKTPTEGNIVAIGFYGKNLLVGHGYQGGWDAFGPERVVTKSDRNILYELDHQSALKLYKNYLGALASELPGSALLFPLSIRLPDTNEVVVRTVLSINESNQSMTFAGNLPQGATAQLMKANFDRLIDGSIHAADLSLESFGKSSPEFALLISCVGRKLVLNQRVEEEVEEASRVLGSDTAITGFYSYGEISPIVGMIRCELHNQTMTITTYRES